MCVCTRSWLTEVEANSATDLRGHRIQTGLGQGHRRQGPSTRPETAGVPGRETGQQTLGVGSAPHRDHPGPCVTTGEHWLLVPAKQQDALLKGACPSSFHANPKGGGREPRNGFSQKSLEEMWVRKCTGARRKCCQNVPALRPHGVSRRRAKGRPGRAVTGWEPLVQESRGQRLQNSPWRSWGARPRDSDKELPGLL